MTTMSTSPSQPANDADPTVAAVMRRGVLLCWAVTSAAGLAEMMLADRVRDLAVASSPHGEL